MTAQDGKWVQHFLARHPVFTHGQFAAAQPPERSGHTVNSILAYHLGAGHLVRIRRGLYGTVPRGVLAGSFQPDPYLVAAHLADDAVVAYHTALQFHGRACTVMNRFQYLSGHRGRRFHYRGSEFVPVQFSALMLRLVDRGGGVEFSMHAGSTVPVTSLERTMVDVLDDPEHGGGWEEIWRSLESVEFFDLEAVVRFTAARGSALTAARVGFYLEQHAGALMVPRTVLQALRRLAPRQPAYIDRRRLSGRLLTGWNLIVPDSLLSRAWDEVK